MSDSRTLNTTRNSIVGISTHLLRAVLAFVTRTVFIKVLGVDYLGINGLFANILTLLALSDLGIYTVMTYSLYAPLAKNDTSQIAALIRYFQKLYNIIAFAVLGLGLALIPFLPKLVHGISLSYAELTRYYVILLFNSVISYFVISRSTLFQADQKVYVVRLISTLSTFLMYITQIILLVLFRNFTIYLVCQVIYTLLNNVVLFFVAARKYPYLRTPTEKTLIEPVKQELVKNLKASFCYKISAHIMNSTDNILISVLISTAMVGYFSNYVTLYSMVNTFIMIFIEAVLASIGHFLVTESSARKYELFKMLLLVMYGLAAFSVSCYLAGMNDFIRIWIGEQFIIGGGFIYALALNRFIFCAVHPLWMMRESSGLFVATRYVMLTAAFLNIGLSVWLGKWIGISGIILATSFSYLLTIYWYEPWLLAKKIFQIPIGEYWKYIFKLLGASLFPLLVGGYLMQLATAHLGWLLIKFIICGLMSFLSFFLCFRNTAPWENILQKLVQHVKKRSKMV